MRGSKLRGSRVFAFSIGDVLATVSDMKDAMCVCDCGFSEPSLI